MPDTRLDPDELLRILADAWRSASRSNEFPWGADVALQSSRIPGGFVEHHAVSEQQRLLQERVRPLLRRWSTAALALR